MRIRPGTTLDPGYRQTATPASVLSESLVDGSGERLGDVGAAPGERRPRVDAEASEDAGERLGLEERARDLFVGAGAGRRMCVNDGPRRGALAWSSARTAAAARLAREAFMRQAALQ